MPTPIEIKEPRLTYCKDREEHCLCPKCKQFDKCHHSCDHCQTAEKIIAKGTFKDFPTVMQALNSSSKIIKIPNDCPFRYDILQEL